MFNNFKVMIVAAMDKNRGIGYNNSLPWPSIPEDIALLKNLTKDKLCVVGRKTFENLPKSFKKDRRFWVLTNNQNLCTIPGITYSRSEEFDPLEDFFVIGGSEIYNLFLEYTDEIYISIIQGEYKVDSYMPKFEKKFLQTDIILQTENVQTVKYSRSN